MSALNTTTFILTQQRFCKCAFPVMVYPGKCIQCELPFKGLTEIHLQAMQLPNRFWLQMDIDGAEYESLFEPILNILREIYVEILPITISAQQLVGYFRDRVYERVRDMLDRHLALQLTQEDADAFHYKTTDLVELTGQMRI